MAPAASQKRREPNRSPRMARNSPTGTVTPLTTVSSAPALVWLQPRSVNAAGSQALTP